MSTELTERRWTHEGRPELHRLDYTFRTRRAAKPGPWWDEPDKIQWVDPATDLDCLMVRNHFGVWCGYVGVPPTHPLHGRSYDGSEGQEVDVHGGLTFADSCNEEAEEGYGICHVPYPGREPDVWWLGFDCGHAFDYSPGLDLALDELPGRPVPLFARDIYRDEAYVRAECTSLATQLAAVR